jgi:hypothetical protein
VDCIAVPCCHASTCIQCSASVKQCPVCEVPTTEFKRIFIVGRRVRDD